MLIDWFDSIIENWLGLLFGVIVGVGAQAALAIFSIVIGLPTETGAMFVAAELCVGLGGFIAGLLARRVGLVSSITVGVICAFVSLIASVWVNPKSASIMGVVVLFVGYGLMATLGGSAAWLINNRRGSSRDG